jgi:hypothetical protein
VISEEPFKTHYYYYPSWRNEDVSRMLHIPVFDRNDIALVPPEGTLISSLMVTHLGVRISV